MRPMNSSEIANTRSDSEPLAESLSRATVLALRPTWESRHLAALQPPDLLRDKLSGTVLSLSGSQLRFSLLNCDPATYDIVTFRVVELPSEDNSDETRRIPSTVYCDDSTNIIVLPALPPALQPIRCTEPMETEVWRTAVATIHASLMPMSLCFLGLPRPRLLVLAGSYGSGKSKAVVKAVGDIGGATLIRHTAREVLRQNVTKSGLELALLGIVKDATAIAPSGVLLDDAHFLFPPEDDDAPHALDVAAQYLQGSESSSVILILTCSPDEYALHPQIAQLADLYLRPQLASPVQAGVHAASRTDASSDFSCQDEISVRMEQIDIDYNGEFEQPVMERRNHGVFAGRKNETPYFRKQAVALERVRAAGYQESGISILDPTSVSTTESGGDQDGISRVAGLSAAKQALTEVASWAWTRKSVFQRLGVAPKKGALLYGPPGTGKTLLVREIASTHEAIVVAADSASIARSDVGASENMLKAVYSSAKALAPSIVFLDEIDALFVSKHGSQQSDTSGLARLSATLTRMIDKQGDGVVTIGATNRPWLLPRNLMCASRLDVCIHVGLPAAEERVALAKMYGELLSLADCEVMQLQNWAASNAASRMSGADIAGACRRAVMRSAMDDATLNASDIIRSFHEVGPFVSILEADEFLRWNPP